MAIRTLHLGVGGRGVWPWQLFPQRDDVQVAGLCDLRPEALTTAREATGLDPSLCRSDWRQALEQIECDAVVVITPPHLHFEMCLAAVQAGKHVLVEKPFTMDLAEAWQVVEAADAAGVKLVASQQARYIAGNRAAIDLLAGGEVGGPEYGTIVRMSSRPGVHHSGHQRDSYAWERGVHDFDVAWSLFDSLPATIRASNFNPSWSPYEHGAGMFAVVEYESGAVCSFVCSFMSHHNDNSVVVQCRGGSLLIGGNDVTIQPSGGGEPRVISAAGYPQPEAQVVDDFVGWIHGGPEPVSGMNRNLWILAMVEATGVSSAEGRVVDVDEHRRSRRGDVPWVTQPPKSS